MDFFGEAISRLEEDDTIVPLFTKAMADISAKLSTLSMNDDYKPYVNVSCHAAAVPAMCLRMCTDLVGSLDVLEISSPA